MQDRDLTKGEAAALLGSKDATGKAIDRLVTDGLLTRYDRPRIGKRYLESEVLALKAGRHTKPEQQPEQRKATREQREQAHEECIFATPGTNPVKAAHAVNELWSRTGIDAVLRNNRRPDDRLCEWPALVASPYFGPELEGREGIIVRWDVLSEMTHAFVVATICRDQQAAMAELARIYPEAVKPSA